MALDRLTKIDGGGISTTSDYRVGIITATKFVGPIEGDVTGSITATDGTFSGNVTIGGTLTYEDVTNIDSVGVITARDGIDCNADLDVDGTTNLDHVFVSQHLRVTNGGGLQVTGITTSQAFRATGGTVSITDGGITGTVSNAALVIDEGTRIYTKEDHNGYMRNLIGKIDDVISIGSSNTGFVDEIALFPGNAGPVTLFHGTNNTIPKFKTTSTGIEIVGKTDTDTLLVSGASDLNGDLDVDGHTNLDNVSVAGITTFSDRIIGSNSASTVPTAKFTNSGTGNQLELYGSSTSTILIKATNNNGTPKLQLRDNYNRDNFIAVTESGDNLVLAVDEGNGGSDSTMRFRVDGGERLRIKSDGNVGIKSTAPRGKLDIQFDGAPSFITFGADADNPKVEFFRHTGGSPSHYATEIQMVLGDLVLSTAATANLGSHSYSEKLRIKSDGRMMIGTTSPSSNAAAYMLTVADPNNSLGNSGITIRAATGVSGGTHQGSIFFSNATSGAGEFAGYLQYNHNDNWFRIGTNSAEKLRINSTGQIITNGSSSDNPFPTRGLTLLPATSQTNNYVSIIAGNTSSVSGVTFGTSASNNANNYRAMFEYYHSGFAHNEGLRFLSAGTEALRIRGGTAAGDILYGPGDHVVGASPGLINGLGSHNNANPASVLYGINDGGGYNGMKVINFDDGTYNSQRIEFLTGKGGVSMATVRMGIDENGLVSIGRTISANSSFNASTNQLVVGNGVGNQGMLVYTGASHAGSLIFNDVADGTFQGGISYKHGSGASDNCLKFFANADERVRITKDGYLWVNRTSSSDKGRFEVQGFTADDIQVSDISAKTIATFSGSTPGTTAAGKGAGIVIKPIRDRGCNYFLGVANSSTNQEAHGRFIIRSGNFYNQSVERFRITEEGYVRVYERLELPNGETYMQEGSGNSVRIVTNNGYVDIGAQNSSFCHISTDRAKFYLNSATDVNGHLAPYGGGTHDLGGNGNAWRNIYGGTLSLSSYAVLGSLVVNDPGSSYYSFNNRIGGNTIIKGTTVCTSNIHTTAPSTFPASNVQLMVYNSTNGQPISNTDCARILIATDAKQTGSQGYNGAIDFGNSDASASGGGAEYNWRLASIMSEAAGDTSSTIGDGDLQFWTKTASGSLTRRMQILANGIVDIYSAYTNAVGGSTRDLYVRNDGRLGYLSSVRASKTNIVNLTDISWLDNLEPKSFNMRKKE